MVSPKRRMPVVVRKRHQQKAWNEKKGGARHDVIGDQVYLGRAPCDRRYALEFTDIMATAPLMIHQSGSEETGE